MYTGYKEIVPSDAMLAKYYSDRTENWFNCVQNEYIIIKDQEGQVIDKAKWTGERYADLSFKRLQNDWIGRVAPRNPQQHLAFDMLQDSSTTIKILTGSYGSGKTFLMVAHALDLIKKGEFDRLVWVRNNIEVKDSAPLGMLPGSAYDKLLPYAGPLIDHVGGIEGLNALIDSGIIELQHLGYIRGRDIKNSIIISSEAENLTKQHVQLLIGRVGEGSNLWLDGDYRQVDKAIFKENSGLEKAVSRLAGEPLFAYVDMPISERSATAKLADKLD